MIGSCCCYCFFFVKYEGFAIYVHSCTCYPYTVAINEHKMLMNDVYVLVGPERGKGSSPPAVPPFPSPHLLSRRTRTGLSHLEVIPFDCERTRQMPCVPQSPTFTFHESDTMASGDNGVSKQFTKKYCKLGL